MHRIKIDLSYKGTNFHGWQIQENANTVQAELNNALSTVLRENIETVGCGRTDTGVHAKQYTAHFDCENLIEDFDKLKYKLNSLLPKDIAVYNINETHLGFHARFDAVKRTYKYFIHSHKNPFINEYSTFIHYELDVDVLNKASELLIGRKDFTSFSKLHTDVTNNYCDVTKAYWESDNEGNCIFTISANRFLRNMVRAIVGTFLILGNKDIDIEEIINLKDRSKAGVSAPPQGLFLWSNEYPVKK